MNIIKPQTISSLPKKYEIIKEIPQEFVTQWGVSNTTSGCTIDLNDDLIEEIAIWNTKLSDDEVALLYSSKLKRMPLQIQPANLKLYLPLDDHTAGTALNTTVFKDLSGNGNDGTGTDADADSSTTAEVLNYPPAIGQFN